MSMTTRSLQNVSNGVEQRDAADAGPKGADGLKTIDEKPTMTGSQTQSPASLHKMSTIAMKPSENTPTPVQSPASLQANTIKTVSSIVAQDYGKA